MVDAAILYKLLTSMPLAHWIGRASPFLRLVWSQPMTWTTGSLIPLHIFRALRDVALKLETVRTAPPISQLLAISPPRSRCRRCHIWIAVRESCWSPDSSCLYIDWTRNPSEQRWTRLYRAGPYTVGSLVTSFIARLIHIHLLVCQ
jgi:hypothetical protein